MYRYIITHDCVNLNGFQTMVRDRVLETLRLTASELESDVSTNSTNPAYSSQADFLPHRYFYHQLVNDVILPLYHIYHCVFVPMEHYCQLRQMSTRYQAMSQTLPCLYASEM